MKIPVHYSPRPFIFRPLFSQFHLPFLLMFSPSALNLQILLIPSPPGKTKVVPTKKKAPWRNTTQVKFQKRECRQAKRRRKTKLQIHNNIYKEKLRIYNSELKRVRQSFLSGIINKNINNPRTLFTIVDKLTNSSASVPHELLSTKSCNNFASFFTEKNLRIRQTISNSTSGKIAQSPAPQNKTT